MLFLKAILPVLCSFFAAAQAQKPSVNVSQGVIVGDKVSDGGFYAFYGIPYAGNPSGANRFKAPPPAPKFPGDFHAIDSNKRCAQPSSNGLVGEEDCLILNIFTKNLTATSPVIVWIEGEDYLDTAASHHKSYKGLVERSNVVVTLNYRLSIFGFLCLGVEEAPGNAGLKDVIAGLKWIQDNIAGFGGDKNNVVLFGHGSGAAVVDLISLSPASAGLVHKAIVSSGSGLAPWAVSYDPVRSAQAVGRELQYFGKKNTDLAQAFKMTEVNVLINAVRGLTISKNSSALFAPCIENPNLSKDAVLTEPPINILRSGNYNHIPYLTGYVNREGTVRAYQAVYENWLDSMQSNFTEFVQVDLGFSSISNKSDLALKIRKFYFGETVINMGVVEDYLDYFGDTMFLVSIIRGAWERALTSKAPVRLYQFGYRGTPNRDWSYNFPLIGVPHGAILNYIFDFGLSDGDRQVQASLLNKWTAFAFNGSPVVANPRAQDWPAISKDNYYYYTFSGEVMSSNTTMNGESSAIDPHKQRMTFWNDIYNVYYVAPKAASSSRKVMSFTVFLVVSQLFVFLV